MEEETQICNDCWHTLPLSSIYRESEMPGENCVDEEDY